MEETIQNKGSVLGGTLLIAGSCIGAGMLALPILTGLSGFFPSFLMFMAAWVFMTLTALLLIEVNGWFPGQVNIVSMSKHSLGRIGQYLSWVLYLFLFFSLNVAYVSASGSLAGTFFRYMFNWNFPDWLGSAFFVCLFGYVVYLGTRPVDLWNRGLMAGKIIAYIALVFFAIPHIEPGLWLRTEPAYALYSLPVLVISFGFHNMIPTLTSYMGGDLKRVRASILCGSLFALLIYLIWQLVVLGIVPREGPSGIVDSLKNDQEASQSLAGILGTSLVSSSAQALAFFAILTSFLAQSLSLVHFLADGLKIPAGRRENKALCTIALIPPLLLSIAYPQLFFKALNFAGGVCAVILFGILPVSMVWIGRYFKGMTSAYQIPGGKGALLSILAFALFVLFFQISSMLQLPFIPKP